MISGTTLAFVESIRILTLFTEWSQHSSCRPLVRPLAGNRVLTVCIVFPVQAASNTKDCLQDQLEWWHHKWIAGLPPRPLVLPLLVHRNGDYWESGSRSLFQQRMNLQSSLRCFRRRVPTTVCP